MPTCLLFSDVDGTLLGGDGTYAVSAGEWGAVRSRIDLVLASSRTVLELSRNQDDLGVEGPVVAENGAVMAWPASDVSASDATASNATASDATASDALADVGALQYENGRAWRVVELGVPASVLRAELRDAARTLGVAYVDQEEVEATLGRRCSVLLRPVPGASFRSLAALADALRARGRSVASGGSWLAITGEADKGVGVRAVRALWPRMGRVHRVVAAVGDGDNDIPLLEAVERRFVIARDDGTWHPALRAIPRAECVPTPGIAGWRDVIRSLTASQEE